jgi:hypothetical protein
LGFLVVTVFGSAVLGYSTLTASTDAEVEEGEQCEAGDGVDDASCDDAGVRVPGGGI